MDYSKFTPEFKDEILNKICDNFHAYRVSTCTDIKQLCDDIQLLEICLNQFAERGLIADLSITPRCCRLSVCSPAYDLIRHGGFTLEENILMAELEKAKLELKKLNSEPGLEKYVKQISGVTSIITNLISAVGAIRG